MDACVLAGEGLKWCINSDRNRRRRTPNISYIDLNRGFVDHIVIRVLSSRGLSAGFLHPLVHDRPSPMDTEIPGIQTVCESNNYVVLGWMPSLISGSGVASRATDSTSIQSLPPPRRLLRRWLVPRRVAGRRIEHGRRRDGGSATDRR